MDAYFRELRALQMRLNTSQWTCINPEILAFFLGSDPILRALNSHDPTHNP